MELFANEDKVYNFYWTAIIKYTAIAVFDRKKMEIDINLLNSIHRPNLI